MKNISKRDGYSVVIPVLNEGRNLKDLIIKISKNLKNLNLKLSL